ncbi:hypothetical protein [Sunxiuqinia indica]|uniref:hypothetical protein n=1 Tax=Sunxiuqinia indica TaxID=2692584 RepID=UPI00135C0729|nr:hypothetical protein [Sunxiuqinia indica]
MIKQIKTPMWDQMQVFCKHIADHQIRMILKFNSMLNDSLLRAAIEIAIRQNPIIFAKFVEEDKHAFWRFSRSEVDKVFLYKECNDPEPVLNKTILERIESSTEPQLFITLIRSKRSKSDILVLNCNHAITDAAGVKNFAYQLAELYNDVLNNLTFIESPYHPMRSLTVLSNDLKFKQKLDVLKVTASNKKSAPTFHRPIKVDQLQNPDFKIYSVAPAAFERIRNFGKQHGATINDVLLSLFYKTFKSLLPNVNETNRLSYASDLRVFMAAGEYDVLSNFSAIHNIDIDNSIVVFEDIVKEISRQTTIRKQKKYSLADFPVIAMLFKVMPYNKLKNVFHKQFDTIKEGKLHAAPSLTNIGVIEETKLNFDGMFPENAYVLGGVNHPALFQIAVSTYKKQMTISIGTYFNDTNKAFATKFINEFQSNINKEIVGKMPENPSGLEN